jgi:hypothetical protein
VRWLLIIGVIVVVLFATGVVHFDFYARTETAPASASEGQVSTSIVAPRASSALGVGVRTAADVRWLRRMGALCVRRNRRENVLPGPEDDTTRALGRYTAQTQWIWDDYRRRASSVRAPGSYAAEAGWVQQTDAAVGAVIQDVLDAARADNGDAAHAAISGFGAFSDAAYPTFAKIGLPSCGQFQP